MANRSLTRTTLLVILALAFFLRVADLGRNSLWYDELLQLRAASDNLAALVPQLELSAAMPLDYLIERFMLLLGANEFILRFSAATFSTLAVAVLYRVGKAMFNTSAGLLASAFLAVASFAVFYAHEARPYTLYMLLTLASFYWLYRALQTNRLTHWLGYAIFTAAAAFTHLFALFVILAQALFVISGLLVRVVAPQRARLFEKIKAWMIVGVLLAAVLFGLAISFVPNFQYVPGSAMRFLQFLITWHVPPPEEWKGIAPGESPPLPTFDFFYTRILENFSGGGLPATIGFVVLGLCGLATFRRKPWETILLVIWAIVPGALIVLFLMHRATLFAARYLIAALPAWLLLCALGTIALGALVSRFTGGNVWVRRLAVVVIAVLWLSISLERSAFILAQSKEDWRATGQFLDANLRPGDAVLAPGGSYLVYHYAPKAEQQNVSAEVAAQIADAENHYPRVWLVMNRYVYDPGGVIHSWLQERGAVAFPIDYALTVYYWRAHADNNTLLADTLQMQLPAAAITYHGVGNQFAYAGDTKTAARFYAAALQYASTPDYAARIHLAWGDMARRAGNLEQAAQQYTMARTLDPVQEDAWIGLARIELEKKQFDVAHDALTHALNVDPNSYPALLFLAQYYEKTGQSDAAQATYARAAQIVPDLTEPP
ncbi:MAG TPA: glycosyltransferase family 39 protein [Anaerolineae bacterium]|nr:glycosyltransferase family 39 protein [Anaerolineae bacterium]